MPTETPTRSGPIKRSARRRRASALRLGPMLAILGVFGSAPFPSDAFAQQAAQRDATIDSHEDSGEFVDDAALAAPGSVGAPLDNLLATAPGQEEWVPPGPPQFRLNGLFPLAWTNNVQEIWRRYDSSGFFEPRGDLSAADGLGPGLPFRVTATARIDSESYFRVSSSNAQYLRATGRVQYVDPNNDQQWSPYIAIVPRQDFIDTFQEQVSARQDFNFGVQKRWNFDSGLQLVPAAGSTSSSTVFSFGFNTFFQRRLREPQVSSSAWFFIPSASWRINDIFNVSVGAELLRRWLDPSASGFKRLDWEFTPVGTLEIVIPKAVFGGNDDTRRLLGAPAIDLQQDYTRLWSTRTDGGYAQWESRAVLKVVWRF